MARRVAVLMGGWSAEREVSLTSGEACAAALAEAGYVVYTIDVQRDLPALLAALLPRGEPAPDVIFNALHGKGGEDGTVQGVLDFLGIPYTHSGLVASAVAMNKELTKFILQAAGMPFPESRVATLAQAAAGHVMEPPYVVKPIAEGSSVGVQIIRSENESPSADAPAQRLYDRVLVERFIPGRELTVGVMQQRDGARAMTVTEIRPLIGFYDYAAKYTVGITEHIVPAPISPEVTEACRHLAELAHETLGCAGVSRADFRYDDSRPDAEGLFFLELNTQPGMTSLSLVPEQAKHLGMSFAELCAWMVENARCHI